MRAETDVPTDDEDDETPGINFRLMPTIRETGSLRENEVVNVKNEEHCCTVMKNKTREWLDENYSMRNDLPHIKVNKRPYSLRETHFRHGWSQDYQIPLLTSEILDDLDLIVNIQDGMDCIVFKEKLEEIVDLVSDLLTTGDADKMLMRTGCESLQIWAKKTLEEWDECSQTLQDKFEHWDSDSVSYKHLTLPTKREV